VTRISKKCENQEVVCDHSGKGIIRWRTKNNFHTVGIFDFVLKSTESGNNVKYGKVKELALGKLDL
jgi:hypothetical protein